MPPTTTIAPSLRDRLDRSRALVDTRYDEELSLRILAEEAYLSSFHFLRLFRRTYGVTPNRYLQQVRLDRAKDLLIFSDRTITDICMSVGFSSLGSFSRLFRRRLGLSPIRYREQFRADNFSSLPFCYVAMMSGRNPSDERPDDESVSSDDPTSGAK